MNRSLFAGLLALAFAVPASAARIAPTSYDIPNGSGTASGGNFNYWDAGYTGSGDKTTDGAPLTGGLGDLTDGVITTQNWNAVENTAGNGPYVGWAVGTTPNLALTFHFGAAPVDIDTVRIHVDESKFGGVELPSTVAVSWEAGGTQTLSFTIVDDTVDVAPSWLELTGLGITGVSSLKISLGYGDVWVFADEVEFYSSPIPEPSSIALMLAGLGLAGAAARKARR